MHPQDTRHHWYIIGVTGSGKTTLLRNLVIQHIHRGHGVAIIDPHGDLAEELLHHIPPHRADHLVYFDPADTEFPIGFNPLANVPPDERPLVASGIMEAFKTIWGDSWGPRMEHILYHCIAALLDCQNTSLLGVNRMLIDPDYRRWVIRQVKDPFIRQFWEQEFASYDPRFMREAIAPIQNKVGALLASPIIRNILGQVRNKVSIPFIMDDSRIFIANLSKGRMGADKSNLLGSLLVTQFQLAAMARANHPEHDRRDFFLHIDEFPTSNFLDLPKFHALTRLHTNGQPQQPERTRMMGPLCLHCGKPNRLKARSRERFATSRAEVESRTARWLSRS